MNLPITQQLHYQKLKQVISENMESGFKAWAAIKEIKEAKLYLAEFDTWEEFCSSMCKLTPQHVNRMISAFDVSKSLEINKKSEPVGSLLVNERQARALAAVPEAQRAAVIEQIAATGQPVTAMAIAEATRPKQVTDEEGYPVPDGLVEFFVRKKEIKEIQGHIAAVARALKQADESGDRLFGEVNVTGTVSDLRKISFHIGCAIPYAVCYQCQGHPDTQPRNQCAMCKGRGFISKKLLQTVPEELRQVRAKGMKQ